MSVGRRTVVLLVILAAVGLPAGALRALCVNHTCHKQAASTTHVPFCSLPPSVRTLIANGFAEGRSPDVLAVTDRKPVATEGAMAIPWLSRFGASAVRVPIVFWGQGVTKRTLPPNTGLDDVEPTITTALGVPRPPPTNGTPRSGRALAGAVAPGNRRLVLEIVWKGIGSADLRGGPQDWPFLRSLVSSGAGTLDGTTGSLPVDPTATLTTMGTGGTPSEHGIVGTEMRDPFGDLVRAWGPAGPPMAIPALGDDLDRFEHQRSLIGLVAADIADRGIVGGVWYVGADKDTVVVKQGATSAALVAAAEGLLRQGFGKDRVPDVLAVVMPDSIPHLDASTKSLVRAAERATGGSALVVVAGTGSVHEAAGAEAAARVVGALLRSLHVTGKLVDAAGPGGLYLNQATLTRTHVSNDQVARTLLRLRAPGGGKLLADAFPAFAVSLGRYCR